MKYGGYTIVPANARGGRAGRGHNATSTIQVREDVNDTSYLLKAQFRYTVDSTASRNRAIAKARLWVDWHPIKNP